MRLFIPFVSTKTLSIPFSKNKFPAVTDSFSFREYSTMIFSGSMLQNSKISGMKLFIDLESIAIGKLTAPLTWQLSYSSTGLRSSSRTCGEFWRVWNVAEGSVHKEFRKERKKNGKRSAQRTRA